ncbi:L-aspartate oxidase [Pseudarthrobacter sp. YS3]|uniref:L-aspartate oxidase n=1 Tax=Pseudarthrobacter sp. YS3 TaxID=3453718 RepID=UPI003EEFEA85
MTVTDPRRLVVVGSGIAGLYAALLAADAGAEVVLLTKGALQESNTWYAQGGISAVLDEPAAGDTVAAHIADTLKAGAGHCNEEAVRLLCTQARQDIAGLQRFGVRFDVDDDGDPSLGLEAAHSAPRILHAGGDATGAGVADALISAVLARQASGTIELFSHAHASTLRQTRGRVNGVRFRHDGGTVTIAADAVLLATGGAGRLFAQTTNPAVATADGLALAWRAGATVADLEFFQFHPTCLVNPAGAQPEPMLISEAVRGEGAVLVDSTGKRFMPEYHPDAELAPRDVVSRSIALHLAKLGDPNGHVYLDARGIELTKGRGFLTKRFPTLTARTREAGIDWTRELVPVAPAAHYWMGGVATDLHARTSVPGLYAAGEVACTGVHGANRLASNSLLEGLVFGRRAVESFLRGESDSSGGDPEACVKERLLAAVGPRDQGSLAELARRGGSWGARGGLPFDEAQAATGFRPALDPAPFSRDALRRLMTAKAGVLRNGVLLLEAEAALGAWAGVVRPEVVPADGDPQELEDANLLLAAQLLVRAALARRVSLGAHYRSDSPGDAALIEELEESYRMRPKASLVNEQNSRV